MRCYNHGRRYFSSAFVLFVVKRTEPGAVWRLGMAVTKKTGSAVRRNRVRRLIRECFRLEWAAVEPGYDYVVVPKRGLDPKALTLALTREQIVHLLHAHRKSSPVSR